jgi:N-acetylglucosamine-6-phosphate deacetylase
MLDAVRFAMRELALPPHAAVRLASYEPARFLRRSHEFGLIAPGRLADLIIFSPQFHLLGLLTGPHRTGVFT